MGNAECKVGIDEFNIVLKPACDVDTEEWTDEVDAILEVFFGRSKIDKLFDTTALNARCPAGYTDALTIDKVSWYFAVAWHKYYPEMGCLVRFSAEAWATYQKVYEDYFGSPMNIWVFLHMILSPIYKVRISRVDLTADFKNYGYRLTPDYIYQKLKKGDYVIKDCKERVTRRKISAIENDWDVETFYIGSKKEKSKLLMRVYDKRTEQIRKSGFRMDEALQCKDWTRFEASYRGDYAHQITDRLINDIKGTDELAGFIAQMILNKYMFYEKATDKLTGEEIDEETEFTYELMDIAENSAFYSLRTEKPENNTLVQSIRYLTKGSGFFPILLKVGCIWGEDAELELLDWLYQEYKKKYKSESRNTDKLAKWFHDNRSSLSKQALGDYLREKYYFGVVD